MLSALAGSAHALGNLADVSIYDRAQARALAVYQHAGRYYVVGRPGNEYQIRVRNGTGTELLAVVSVDGVNAISGETADWSQSGYVLRPWHSLDLSGWRKSLARVAAFFFTEHDNSYAARTGRSENVGVVGVAVFRRKSGAEVVIDSPPRPRESSANQGAAATDSAPPIVGQSSQRSLPAGEPAGALEKSIGTGHGRSETSLARYTHFERASSTPDEVVTIHYDSYRNLVAQGIIQATSPRVASPFPGQFVPDPR
jgi:hypothetical protein